MAIRIIIHLLIVLLLSCKNDTDVDRIDTHIHLYDTRREGSCEFLDPATRRKIYFPHFAKDFVKVAHPAGIKYAVAIEASFRRQDNFWLANVVDTSNSIKAFIANLDPRDPFFIDDLDSLLHYQKFRGIRIRTKTDIDLSLPEIIKKLGELDKRNLILELNAFDPGIIKIAKRYPQMNIIIDHLAAIHIKNKNDLSFKWKQDLIELAAEPNIYCKISALYTLSGQNPAPTDPAFYEPLIEPVIEAFGTQRVMFGSNWTLSELRGTYSDMIVMLDACLNDFPNLDPNHFYSRNALTAYGIVEKE